MAKELRTIAQANVEGLDGIRAEATIEWDAAAKIETMARALREIQAGAEDPRGTAAVALMSVNEG